MNRAIHFAEYVALVLVLGGLWLVPWGSISYQAILTQAFKWYMIINLLACPATLYLLLRENNGAVNSISATMGLTVTYLPGIWFLYNILNGIKLDGPEFISMCGMAIIFVIPMSICIPCIIYGEMFKDTT